MILIRIVHTVRFNTVCCLLENLKVASRDVVSVAKLWAAKSLSIRLEYCSTIISIVHVHWHYDGLHKTIVKVESA